MAATTGRRRAAPSFDALLQGLSTSWATVGAALSEQAARVADERSRWPPWRPSFTPVQGLLPGGEPQRAFAWNELMPPLAMQAQRLQLAFDCVLEHRQGGWQLRIVPSQPSFWRWFGRAATRHHVEITIIGPESATGVVRLDGQLWKRFEVPQPSNATP